MHRFVPLIFFLVLGFGCHCPSKQPHASLRINIHDEPHTLDPRKARSLSGQTLVRMLFEGLTRVNKEEKAELALASNVTVSSDLKTYTFHLKDTLWSNGDPLLASDFIYAWKKVLTPDFPSDTAFHLYVIKNGKAAKEGKIGIDMIGVKLLDEKTFEVELENPTPYFLDLLASPAFFPVNQKVDEKNPSWPHHSSTYVSNGPFQLSQWKHQNQMTLVKNDKYWDASTVKLESLELHMLQEDTELKCFEKHELDWAGSPLSILPVDALNSLRKEKQLNTKELLGTYFIRINTEALPFRHPSMRKAFAIAMNRRAIVDHVTQGSQLPATGVVPPLLKLQKQPYFQDDDIVEARHLFEEALSAQKLTRKDLPEISLTYRTEERNHLIAQAIQQQWLNAFGIDIKLESVESKVYMEKISKQDFQLSCSSWIADFADPINFLEIFKYRKGSSNNTLWENSRFIELLDQSAQVANVDKRMELLAQSEKILIDEMPVIPVFYYTMLYVNRPNLKDVFVSSMGQIDFKWACISKGEKK